MCQGFHKETFYKLVQNTYTHANNLNVEQM